MPSQTSTTRGHPSDSFVARLSQFSSWFIANAEIDISYSGVRGGKNLVRRIKAVGAGKLAKMRKKPLLNSFSGLIRIYYISYNLTRSAGSGKF